MRRTTTLGIGLGVLALAATAGATSWSIDPAHSTVGFSVRHMVISNVRGQFGKFAATADVDLQGPDVKISATIEAASVDTHNDKRDEHVRGADFLDVAKFPQITFTSFKTERIDGGRWRIFGHLTLHGVTKPIELQFEGPSAIIRDPNGLARTGGRATATIQRKDFGINFDKQLDGGGLLVGDDIVVTIDVEATAK